MDLQQAIADVKALNTKVRELGEKALVAQDVDEKKRLLNEARQLIQVAETSLRTVSVGIWE